MASNLKANSVPVLSVLMAVHNGHPYLRESLDSLLRQTYSDFELIVVDDASTDSSLEILQAEKDPRLRIISLKRNLGLADALNLALEHAKGALVARMDADDIASPGRFLAQVERMNSEPGLVLLELFTAGVGIDPSTSSLAVDSTAPVPGSSCTSRPAVPLSLLLARLIR